MGEWRCGRIDGRVATFAKATAAREGGVVLTQRYLNHGIH